MSTPRDELLSAVAEAVNNGEPLDELMGDDRECAERCARDVVEAVVAAGWVQAPTCATCKGSGIVADWEGSAVECGPCGGTGREPTHTAAEWAAQDPPPGMVEVFDNRAWDVCGTAWLADWGVPPGVSEAEYRISLYRRVGAEPGTEDSHE